MKPGPVMPAGTGGQVTVSGTYGSVDSTSSSSSTDTSSTSTDTGSSSTTGPECMNEGELCEIDGTCIAVSSGLACGHGAAGDPCVLPGDCISTQCFAQPDEIDADGICTGDVCDEPMAKCEVDGTCMMIDDGNNLCSHGEVGEPCVVDADCDGAICRDFAVESGTVRICSAE